MKRDEAWNTDKGNRFNIFWRAALGMVYLYLNFAAYQLIGIKGVAIISGFFLIAQFSPFIVRAFNKQSNKQIEQAPLIFVEPGVEQANGSVTPLRLASETEQKSM